MFLDRVVEPMLAMPRLAKRAIVLGTDAALCVLTVWFAYYLRVGEWVSLSDRGWQAALVSLVALPIFYVTGLYRRAFRHVAADTVAAIVQAVVVYGVIFAAAVTTFGIEGVPRTLGIIQPILLLVAVIASRVFGRYWLSGRYRRHLARRPQRRRVLLYGAGSAGRQLATALESSTQVLPIGFIDDDRGLQGTVICGLRVWGPDKLEEIVEYQDVAEILLAMPSASRKRRNEILQLIRDLGIAVRTLPDILDIAHGKVAVSDLRPLEVDDLLGRDPVSPDAALLAHKIAGRCVLVTGAGGSIGSELCRQILEIGPSTLLLLDSSEYALYSIHRELETHAAGEDRACRIMPLLGSVCDAARVREVIATWRPQTVYHAAAYKHVPLVEHNLIEGVRNNVVGTWIVATAAREHDVADFVLISTDKAVRPTNVMGASKRWAEMVLQAIADDSPRTRFSMVRFGNVLGSSGSVVPLFRSQIAAGGPVTVTHPEITRYFMTIPEAAQLVIQAGAMARGGEVFVLDMGEPVRVLDLATRMIELSGLRVRGEGVDGDVDIVFTGLRPGEKLYEELLIGNDPAATRHPRVMMASDSFLPMGVMSAHLARLGGAIERRDVAEARALLMEVVADYRAAPEVVDWVAAEQADRRRSARASVVPLRPERAVKAG